MLHTAVTGESAGYYADYAGDTDRLGRALAEGFAFQGEEMPYRGSPRGEPSAELPATAFVAFLQNHDQIGNRAFGDRISASALPEAVRAATAIVMLSPQIPMLFMGEEWGALTPFPFFCGFTANSPTPSARDAGASSRASRNSRTRPAAPRFPTPPPRRPSGPPSSIGASPPANLHAVRLDWMRRLIAVRRLEVVPRLAGLEAYTGAYEVIADRVVAVRWRPATAPAIDCSPTSAGSGRPHGPPRSASSGRRAPSAGAHRRPIGALHPATPRNEDGVPNS